MGLLCLFFSLTSAPLCDFRTSPVEFIILYQKYLKSCKQPLSVGMRFKMRFETEDTAERRLDILLPGIESLNVLIGKEIFDNAFEIIQKQY